MSSFCLPEYRIAPPVIRQNAAVAAAAPSTFKIPAIVKNTAAAASHACTGAGAQLPTPDDSTDPRIDPNVHAQQSLRYLLLIFFRIY